MDVRFYSAAAPTSVGSLPAEAACLGPLEYYHCNKFDTENMYMGMSESNQEFLSANQTYSGQSEGNEDYEIPPITPPNHADPSLLHLVDSEPGYHPLCHSIPANGLLPSYSYQNMDLQTLMVSNMFNQGSHLLSSQPPTVAGEKRQSADMGKKPKTQKKKKKKDPNEPQKPVSAYALFFRDTQAAIKGQNPNATFGDVSKIVASMWDSLGEEQKQAYKRKTEAAKKEYLKALAAYRASLVSKSYSDQVETKNVQANQPSHMLPPKQSLYGVPPQSSSPYTSLSSFLPSDLQPYHGPPHSSLSRTLSSKSMLSGNIPSPPPSFQISPPLHQQLSLHHQQNSLMNLQQVSHQSLLTSQMAMQVQPAMNSPPAGQQSFSHLQSEYQSSVGSQSPGPSTPSGNAEWDSDYCSRECGINCTMVPRDKTLYLT
ncbi:TOX high mobility group box family member 2 isoform X3 [Protopterus annectens]|uniref:TOX high mobility group box family member 2 isoform X3 n=1 Tax=Protopterus annectens TaxID=7888 RepID=UPI001CFA6AB0|nr:TOX high mobility group box family member 2 isoform X3 [Protopterus annectens]